MFKKVLIAMVVANVLMFGWLYVNWFVPAETLYKIISWMS